MLIRVMTFVQQNGHHCNLSVYVGLLGSDEGILLLVVHIQYTMV